MYRYWKEIFTVIWATIAFVIHYAIPNNPVYKYFQLEDITIIRNQTELDKALLVNHIIINNRSLVFDEDKTLIRYTSENEAPFRCEIQGEGGYLLPIPVVSNGEQRFELNFPSGIQHRKWFSVNAYYLKKKRGQVISDELKFNFVNEKGVTNDNYIFYKNPANFISIIKSKFHIGLILLLIISIPILYLLLGVGEKLYSAIKALLQNHNDADYGEEEPEFITD